MLVVVVGNPLSGGLGHTWRSLPARRTVRAGPGGLGGLGRPAAPSWCAASWSTSAAERSARWPGASSWTVWRRGSPSACWRSPASGAPLALSSGAGASAPAGGETPASSHATSTRRPRHSGRPRSADPPPRPPASAAYVVRPGRHALEHRGRLPGRRGASGRCSPRSTSAGTCRGGARFVDPDHVEAGWRLRLPVDAREGARADGAAAGAPEVAPRGRRPTLARAGRPRHRLAGLCRARPVAPGGAGGAAGSPETWTSDVALSEASRGRGDPPAPLRRRAGAWRRSKPPTACLARTLQGRRRSRRPGRSASRRRASPSGSPGAQADAPEGFAAGQDGAAWHVDHATLDGRNPSSPTVPSSFPSVTTTTGTWLVPLGPGHVLPLLGESAPVALACGTRGRGDAWAWSDTILVTEDPDDPQLRAPRRMPIPRSPGTFSSSATRPRSRRGGATHRRRHHGCGRRQRPDVLVDRQGATLHPMGRVVRPHSPVGRDGQQLEELVAPPAATVPEPEDARPSPAGHSPTPTGRRALRA